MNITLKKNKKRRYSVSEIDCFKIKESISPIEIASKMVLDFKFNALDKIDLNLTPYLKLPVSLIGKSGVNWVYLIAPTQSGKTVFLQICVAYTVDQNPGVLLYVLPDKVSGQKALEQKVISLILKTPFLRKHIKSEVLINKSSINLDTSVIYPAWSGSKASTSSTTAKVVIVDEIRLMSMTQGEESNVIKFANDRLTIAFAQGIGQGFGVSTPSVEGDLLHQQTTIKGVTELFYAVKCKSCGRYEVLDFFKSLKYDRESGSVTVVCKYCNEAYDESNMKREMLKDARYVKIDRATKQIVHVDKDDLSGTVICRYDSLTSPFRSFKLIWDEYIKTRDNLNDYRNFIQAWLAQFWVNDVSKINSEILEEKIIQEERGVVPEWTKVITAGIDSQGSGFFVCIRAWGSERKTRLLDAFFIECHVHVSDAEQVEALFRKELEERILSDEKGNKWQIGLWAIDTGGNRTKEVYEACSELTHSILVKGKDNQASTISYNKNLNLYLVRTSEYLEETEAKSFKGFFEIPYNIDVDYFKQFLNVRKVRVTNKVTGEDKIIWKKMGQNDYRMADVHTFICLDIQTEIGAFRRNLEDENFYYNPLQKAVEVEVENSGSVSQEQEDSELAEYYDDSGDGYSVGDLSSW